jgi:hypothetical protein
MDGAFWARVAVMGKTIRINPRSILNIEIYLSNGYCF